METWFTNPLTLFFRWFFTKLFLEIKYLKKHLKLEYMVEVKNCTFGYYNTIYKYSRLKSSSFGDFTYVARDAQVHYTTVGKFCCIGPNVSTGMGAHPSSTFVSSHPLFYSTRGQAGGKVIVDKNVFDEYQETIIGNDVWIGANALIKYGVTIGNGAIIAAGAVVTKNVEAYTIVGGVPAKYIKHRFTAEQINFLENFRWWDKNFDWIKEHKDLFQDIEKLMVITQNNNNSKINNS